MWFAEGDTCGFTGSSRKTFTSSCSSLMPIFWTDELPLFWAQQYRVQFALGKRTQVTCDVFEIFILLTNEQAQNSVSQFMPLRIATHPTSGPQNEQLDLKKASALSGCQWKLPNWLLNQVAFSCLFLPAQMAKLPLLHAHICTPRSQTSQVNSLFRKQTSIKRCYIRLHHLWISYSNFCVACSYYTCHGV